MKNEVIYLEDRVNDVITIFDYVVLEYFIIRKIVGNDSPIYQMIIRNLHRVKILELREYLMDKLKGKIVTKDELEKCLNEAILKLNVNILEFSVVSDEVLDSVQYVRDTDYEIVSGNNMSLVRSKK